MIWNVSTSPFRSQGPQPGTPSPEKFRQVRVNPSLVFICVHCCVVLLSNHVSTTAEKLHSKIKIKLCNKEQKPMFTQKIF